MLIPVPAVRAVAIASITCSSPYVEARFILFKVSSYVTVIFVWVPASRTPATMSCIDSVSTEAPSRLAIL